MGIMDMEEIMGMDMARVILKMSQGIVLSFKNGLAGLVVKMGRRAIPKRKKSNAYFSNRRSWIYWR